MIAPMPEWVRQSSPSPRAPLVTRVEGIAAKLRPVFAAVAEQVNSWPDEVLRPTAASAVGYVSPEKADVTARLARFLLGEWLLYRAVGPMEAGRELARAHEWFWDGADASFAVPDAEIPDAITTSDALALLPYLLDPMVPATRRDVLRGVSGEAERVRRKKSGVYYTPGDLAWWMALKARPGSAGLTWLDPAAGSGVFLRAAVALSEDPLSSNYIGVDIDPGAAEATAFSLTAALLTHSGRPVGARPFETWRHFRQNQVTADSLLMLPGRSAAGGSASMTVPWLLGDAVGSAAERVDRIITNPPYAALPDHHHSTALDDLHPLSGRAIRDISPMFVESSMRLLDRQGVLSVVMPLSLVASTTAPFRAVRDAALANGGTREFHAFDRMPEGLFGDDVKTRNSILVIDRTGPDEIRTTPLGRWTSRNRLSFLGRDRTIPITMEDARRWSVLPKVGSPEELRLLHALGAAERHLVDASVSSSRRVLGSEISDGDRTVHLSTVAYNQLSLVLDGAAAKAAGHDSTSPWIALTFEDERGAAAAYALLASRVAFWLWHVSGDGFHVTNRLLQTLPFPEASDDRMATLSDLGTRIWSGALKQPQTALNGGSTTVSFNSRHDWTLIDQVDAVCLDLLGAPGEGDWLGPWLDDLELVHDDPLRLIRKQEKYA